RRIIPYHSAGDRVGDYLRRITGALAVTDSQRASQLKKEAPPLKLGFHLPQMGQAATPENVLRVAKEAEDTGFDSVWVTERLLYATNPRSAYPGTPDGVLPDPYRYVLDPLETLTYVAARTSRIGLGTSVLDMP